MTWARLGRVMAGVVLGAALVHAAELTDRARMAFDDYADRAAQSFASAPFAFVGDQGRRLRENAVIGRAGSGSGIIDVSDGLIHHWRGAMFLRGATVGNALQLSQNYARYPKLYASIVSAELLSKDGDTFRVRLRIKERAGMVTSVLDLTSTVTYVRVDSCRGYSMSRATEIREIVSAGQPGERALAPGTGNGYLWQARTFSSYVQKDGGLYLSLETLGLSRQFPAMLGWIIEPIARRLGRKSVEGSLTEFRRGLMTIHAADGQSIAPCS